MSDYDSPWKEALDGYFEPFLQLFFGEAHADIDWSRGYESLDKELQQVVRTAKSGRRVVDKLVKVWLKDGREQWLLIHVEVQMARKAKFAQRMYVCNYRLFDKYNKEVVSLAVLGDSNPRWRPASFGYKRWGFEAGIRFPVIKLLDFAQRRQELEESENPFAIFILAHLDTVETRRDKGERCNRKFCLVKRLYERGLGAEDVRKLFHVIDWMMDLPEELAENFLEEVKEYEEKKKMVFITTPERIGLKRGLSQGLSLGLIRAIELILKAKFGKAGPRLLPEIRQIESKEQLEAILLALASGDTLDDVRRICAQPAGKQ